MKPAVSIVMKEIGQSTKVIYSHIDDNYMYTFPPKTVLQIRPTINISNEIVAEEIRNGYTYRFFQVYINASIYTFWDPPPLFTSCKQGFLFPLDSFNYTFHSL